MARKIRFPLKMKNGAEVRTLDELKANFDLESILGYFTDGTEVHRFNKGIGRGRILNKAQCSKYSKQDVFDAIKILRFE